MKRLAVFILLSVPVWAQINNGGGGGTVGPGTTGKIPKFATATTIGDSLVSDNGTTLTYTGSGGVNSAGPISSGTAPTACGSATACFAGTEAATAGTPTTGQSYWRFSSTAHNLLFSFNNGAEGPLPVNSGGTGFSAQTLASLTDGATVTWTITTSPNASLLFTTHGGSRTLNISGLAAGYYMLRLTQDATGGEGLTLGTGCTWKVIGGGSGAISLSSTANAVDVLTFYYDGSTNCYANLGKNYS